MNNPSCSTHPKAMLQGKLTLPGDKSVSHRALILAALPRLPRNSWSGRQSERPEPIEILGLADNADVRATRDCLHALGVEVQQEGDQCWVTPPVQWQAPVQSLDCKNSGTTMRLLAGVLAAQPFASTLIGDDSLMRRPMARIAEPLCKMGAQIALSEHNTAPIHISPLEPNVSSSLGGREVGGTSMRGIQYTLSTASAQVKSALLLAGLYAEGDTCLIEPVQSRDHTERLLADAEIELVREGNQICLPGRQIDRLHLKPIRVPGDISTAAFWIVGSSLMPGSRIQLVDVSLNPTRLGLVQALQSVGAKIFLTQTDVWNGEPVGTISVESSELTGDITLRVTDMPTLIDEVPILAMAGLYLKGALTIQGAGELRVKESDRLASLMDVLRRLRIQVDEQSDGLVIQGNPERRFCAQETIQLSAYRDHRMALSLRILQEIVQARQGEQMPWLIDDLVWVDVSYPGFESDLARLKQDIPNSLAY